ncbi:MAG TPA: hypothetical protein VFJ45_08610 [bacterium]|nr:hypothetical protein [bacterium]
MRLTFLASLLALSAALTPASAQERYADFVHRVSKDEFDDSDRSFIFTPPLDADAARPDASLMWRCLEDGLNVIYYFGKYLAGDSDEEVRVRYRIDELPATGFAYWGMMSSNKGAWMPMHQIADFTALAQRSARIVVEVEDPVDNERVRDTFSLKGLSAALQTLSCR